MKISELGLRATIDNLWGEIGFTGEMKEISGVSKKTGKDYAFHTQFIVLNNVGGKIIDPITDDEIEITDDSCAVNLIVHSKAPITKDMKGQTLSLSHLTIREYKDGEETKRTLNAKMPDHIQPPAKDEKVAVSSNSTTPLVDNEVLTILKEMQIKVDDIHDLFVIRNCMAFTEEPLKKIAKVSHKVEKSDELTPEQRADIEKYKKIYSHMGITSEQFDKIIEEEGLEWKSGNVIQIKACIKNWAKVCAMTPKENL